MSPEEIQEITRLYVSGPYDNSDKIVASLRETVVEGNFDYLMLG